MAWAVTARTPDLTYSDAGVDWAVHLFTASGSITFTGAGDIEYLCVAGGGGGGRQSGGAGGGGAGGFLTAVAAVSAAAYAITVGAGGNPGAINGSNGTAGGNSSIAGICTSIGGGGGSGLGAGVTGGSAGGNRWAFGTPTAGTSGQGNRGGAGALDSSRRSGGGGGANAAGGDGTTVPGDGGAGKSSSITGTAVTYAGGGGGATGGVGGIGGGGDCGDTIIAGENGVANTGGGGGGSRSVAGTGGFGVVIIRVQVTSAGPDYVDTEADIAVNFDNEFGYRLVSNIYANITADFAVESQTAGIIPVYVDITAQFGEEFTAVLVSELVAGDFGANPFGGGVFGEKTIWDSYANAQVVYGLQAAPRMVHLVRASIPVNFGDNLHIARIGSTFAELSINFDLSSEWILLETKYPQRSAAIQIDFATDVRKSIIDARYVAVPIVFGDAVHAAILLPYSYASVEVSYDMQAFARHLWEPIPDLDEEFWEHVAFTTDPIWRLKSPGQGSWS